MLRILISYVKAVFNPYKILVILGALMVLHITYLESAKHCRKKDTTRLVAVIQAQLSCPDKECLEAVYEMLAEDRRIDSCKYINYGE